MLNTAIFLVVSAAIVADAFAPIADQKFSAEPADQVAVVGTRIIFPCRVTNMQGVLQWTKDDFGLGIRRQLGAFDRYSMIGSDEEGDYSLHIYPVELDDDGVFQCQVSPGEHGSAGLRSTFATLTVLQAPDAPTITEGHRIDTVENGQIKLECQSANGKPAAELTWADETGQLLRGASIEYSHELAQDQLTFISRSTITMRPDKTYFNKSISCLAQSSVDDSIKVAKTLLVIKYAPAVTVSVAEGALDTRQIPEGNMVTFKCTANAYPADVTYAWSLNDEILSNQNEDTFILFNVTRSYQDAIVKCIVQNEIGMSSDSETLDVTYQPSFESRPSDVEAERGEEVSLLCKVLANPVPDIFWVFDPIDRINHEPRVIGTGTSLRLIAADETAGRYYCKATSIGYVEISAAADLRLKGPPKILPKDSITGGGLLSFVRETDVSVSIECSAVSVPKAKHVAWQLNGQDVHHQKQDQSTGEHQELFDDDSEQIFAVYERYQSDGGIKSTLSIAGDYRQHLGRYRCTVVNSYGADSAEIELIEFDDMLTIYMVVGAASLCTIFVIMVVLLVKLKCCKAKEKILPPADLIPKDSVVTMKGKHYSDKSSEHRNSAVSIRYSCETKTIIPPSVDRHDETDYDEQFAMLPPPPPPLLLHFADPAKRYPESFGGGGVALNNVRDSCNSNVTATDGLMRVICEDTSYVNYAKDFYSPTLQRTNHNLLQKHRDAAACV